jgi:hypothetical protein
MYAIICITSAATALYLMQEEIIMALKKAFGFCVIGQGFKKRHYTFTFGEAVEWAACYDVATVYKRGNFVALKAAK